MGQLLASIDIAKLIGLRDRGHRLHVRSLLVRSVAMKVEELLHPETPRLGRIPGPHRPLPIIRRYVNLSRAWASQ